MSRNDVIYSDSTGTSTLIGGTGFDTLWAGTGGDYLAAGTGVDSLYGGPGNDTIQLHFLVNAGSADGPTVADPDTIVGGPGLNTIVLKPDISTSPFVIQAEPAPATNTPGIQDTISVSDAIAIDPNGQTDFPITIDNETMLVTGVNLSANTFRVQRGYVTPLPVTQDPTITANVPDATMLSAGTSMQITVSDAAELDPDSAQQFVIQIDNEQMLVTNVDFIDNTLTVDRGFISGPSQETFDSSTAVIHTAGAPVIRVFDPTTIAGHDLDAGVASGNPLLIPVTLAEPLDNQSSSQTLYVSSTAAIAAALNAAGESGLVITIDDEQMSVQSVAGPNAIVVTRAVNGTTISEHAEGAIVSFAGQLSVANNYGIYLNSVAGSSNEFVATLTDQNDDQQIGSLNFTMPSDVANIQLDGGPGNNVIQVDPSVTRNVYLYGGPGNNTLMSGSGNDTLVAGPGTAVLYGGTGDDILYGGDLPSQDATPNLSSDESSTPGPTNLAGHDTLIAGSGDSELIAGNGGDLLIGGSVARQIGANGVLGQAITQNGQYELIEGAGRDVLVGGSGNDLLIAGPGGPGAVLEAGAGNETLVADNYGSNVLLGGPGMDLLLGGNLQDSIIGRSIAGMSETLVGGLGADTLTAGAGNDVLYATPNPAMWSRAQATAETFDVHLVPPSVFQGDELAGTIQSYLVELQNASLPSDQRNSIEGLLKPLLTNELEALQSQETDLFTQIDTLLNTPNLPAAQQQDLDSQLGRFQIVVGELGQVAGFLQGTLADGASYAFASVAGSGEDVLLGGAGNDSLYGNPTLPTWMGGGSGDQTFYNYDAGDTVVGNYIGQLGVTDALAFQGDNRIEAFNLQTDQDETGVQVTLTSSLPGQSGSWDVGNDVRGISGINLLEVQTGSGIDTVTLGYAQSAGLAALVECGPGTDTVEATTFNLPVSLLGGAGNDIFQIGTDLSARDEFVGSTTGFSELDVRDTTSVPISLISGILSASLPINITNFSKLALIGGPGTNAFTTDGSFPDMVLEGGNGSNNTFNVIGPGQYTIFGAGPVVSQGSGPAGVSNTLNVTFNDSDNDTVSLSHNGSVVSIAGTLAQMALSITATNLTGVSVTGGSGNNMINAANMVLPVTLNGGSGNGADTLYGGAGSDILEYSGIDSSYYGGGGQDELVYQAPQGAVITTERATLLINGAALYLGNTSGIANLVITGNPTSVNGGQQLTCPLDQDQLTLSGFGSPSVQQGSGSVFLSGIATDPNANANITTNSTVINWGDGTSSSLEVTNNGNGTFNCTASHIYASYGNYRLFRGTRV
jgi:Ca2+-binding RTX toxin-like protein